MGEKEFIVVTLRQSKIWLSAFYVQVKESIRGDDVFIIQPLCNPVNENLMELLMQMATP